MAQKEQKIGCGNILFCWYKGIQRCMQDIIQTLTYIHAKMIEKYKHEEKGIYCFEHIDIKTEKGSNCVYLKKII